MEAIISPEAYQEHVKLYDKYRADVASHPSSPDHKSYNAMILHKIYFDCIKESTPPTFDSLFIRALESQFGSIENFVDQIRVLAQEPTTLWILLKLDLLSHNLILDTQQDHSTSSVMAIPLMVLDLYEHAYWMDWGADRDNYVDAFLANLNWRHIEQLYNQSQHMRIEL